MTSHEMCQAQRHVKACSDPFKTLPLRPISATLYPFNSAKCQVIIYINIKNQGCRDGGVTIIFYIMDTNENAFFERLLPTYDYAMRRLKQAVACSRALTSYMQSVLCNDKAQIMPHSFSEDVTIENNVVKPNPRGSVRYSQSSDTFELGFVLFINVEELPGIFVIVKFCVHLHQDTKEWTCHFSTESIWEDEQMISKVFGLSDRIMRQDVLPYARKLISAIADSVCNERTWLPKMDGDIRLTYPDSWIRKI